MSPSPRPHLLARHPWLIGPLLLASTGLGFALVMNAPGTIAIWVLGGGTALALIWILGSAFWPAKADRGCPECGADALRRMDPNTTRGLVCTACGHRDPEASGWFLAEEEGVLDDILAQETRGRR